jgi:outer membrane biosynthesis protein TonB
MLKRHGLQIFWLALAVTQVAFPFGSPVQQPHSEGTRKVIVEIRPVYPPLARKTNLSGIVRLRVTVSPAGYSVRTEQLGSSPLLVKAATDAVSRAKWAPTAGETQEIVEIKFQPDQK